MSFWSKSGPARPSHLGRADPSRCLPVDLELGGALGGLQRTVAEELDLDLELAGRALLQGDGREERAGLADPDEPLAHDLAALADGHEDLAATGAAGRRLRHALLGLHQDPAADQDRADALERLARGAR